MPAPRNNKNAAGKRRERDRLSLSMGISGELLDRFSEHLLNDGRPDTDENIRQLARDWAYQVWWQHLKRASDESEAIIV